MSRVATDIRMYGYYRAAINPSEAVSLGRHANPLVFAVLFGDYQH